MQKIGFLRSNSFCKIIKTSDKNIKKLDKLLTISFPRQQGAHKFLINNKFPSGLFWYIQKTLIKKKSSLSLRWKDKRKIIKLGNDLKLKKIKNLYEYQKEGFKIAQTNPTGIFAWATNAGKSILITLLVKNIKGKVGVFCETVDVFTELEKAFKENLNEEIGFIGDGIVNPKRITLCMIPTLYSRLYNKNKIIKNFLNSLDGFIQDEVHHSASNRTYVINLLCKNAYFRYGFSGTAQESHKVNNLKVQAALGSILQTISNKKLIELGISAKPIIYIHRIKVKQPYGYRYNFDYLLLFKKVIVKDDTFNNKILSIIPKNKRAFIPVKLLEQGQALNAIINNSIFVYGNDKKSVREKIKKAFEDKKITTIITTVFKEGSNIPGINVTINAMLGKTSIGLLQWIIGRSIRKKKNESNIVEIHDFYIEGSKMLEKHSKKRISKYKKEGFEIIYR